MPAEHAAHERSLVVEPGTDSPWPAAQVFQLVHCETFVVVENVPVAQVLQLRSVVAEPLAFTYEPALHVVQLEHVVALATVE